MLQYGKIAQKVDNYTYKVRIPRYDKIAEDPSAIQTSDLGTAVVCSRPGDNYVYQVNDTVIVGFNNDEIDNRVILGLLYAAVESSSVAENIATSEALNELNTAIEEVAEKSYKTFVRYSNDGGQSFTSLFNADDVAEIDDEGEVVISNEEELNLGEISSIQWTILDADGNNVSSRYHIDNILNDEFTLEGSSVTVPSDIKGQIIELTYKLRITKAALDGLSISLHTDRTQPGTIEGDYVGFLTAQEASINPSDYVWIRVESSLVDDLLARIVKMEHSLYGYDDDGTGLVDAFTPTSSEVLVHKQVVRRTSTIPKTIFGPYHVSYNDDDVGASIRVGENLLLNTQDNRAAVGGYVDDEVPWEGADPPTLPDGTESQGYVRLDWTPSWNADAIVPTSVESLFYKYLLGTAGLYTYLPVEHGGTAAASIAASTAMSTAASQWGAILDAILIPTDTIDDICQYT